MLRILLDIAEVLLGFVAAVVALVTILTIFGQFVREYRERAARKRRLGAEDSETEALSNFRVRRNRSKHSREVRQAGRVAQSPRTVSGVSVLRRIIARLGLGCGGTSATSATVVITEPAA